jgi:murein DD-endopeptidase MepM/ murein hydrolase activator NlpD
MHGPCAPDSAFGIVPFRPAAWLGGRAACRFLEPGWPVAYSSGAVRRGAPGSLAPLLLLAGALAAASACSPGAPRESRRTPPARAPEAPPTPAVATDASKTLDRPDEAAERAARLGLGTETTIVHLFVGPAPEEWVREAGGTEPPRVLAWPVESGRGLRGYGAGDGGKHRGIDIGADEGTPIHAAAEGLVGYAGDELSGYGKVVVLLHPGGWVTLYAHASELIARPGQLVARGEVIAKVGHTGNAQGDHLHFELRRDGHKVNPAAFLTGAPERMRQGDPLPLPAKVRIHRVKRSDRLSKVARGSGMSLRELAALNGLDIRDTLSTGYRLMILRGRPGVPRPPKDEPRVRRAGRDLPASR